MNLYNVQLVAQRDAQPTDQAVLYLYGVFGQGDRQINSREVVPLVDNLSEWGYQRILLRMNTPGGSPHEALAIIEALVASGLEVTVKIDGLLCSAGVLFLQFRTQAIDQGNLLNIMIHQASISEVKGYADDLRDVAVQMDMINERMAQVLADKMGRTVQEVVDTYLVKGTDYWLTVQQAHALGLIDEVLQGAISNRDKIAAMASPVDLEARLAIASMYQDQTVFTPFANNKIMLKIVAQLNGVPGITVTAESSEEQIAAAVQRVVALNTEMTGKIQTLTQERDTARTEKETLEKGVITAKADALIDAAVTAQKITQEQGQSYKSVIIDGGDKSYQSIKSILDGMQPVKSATASIKDASLKDEKVLQMTFKEAQKADKLEYIQANYPEHYDTLFEAEFGRKPKA